jgi:aryl-alcohol dehydrogenase-like predicted oxidoreductase
MEMEGQRLTMSIDYRPLGTTGVMVSPFVLGTASLGPWGNGSESEDIRLIHRALDAGINVIDTADEYSHGATEETVGRALATRNRDDVIVSTKFHFPNGDDPNSRGNSRRWIVRAVEGSLRRLGTEWIDIYFVHRPDPACDLDETLGALSDLVQAGKIRYPACSTFPAHMIVESQWVAERRNRQRFVCEQPPYSLLVRAIETDVLPVCEQFRMAVFTWSPLSGGWLAGGYRKGHKQPWSSRGERLKALYDMSIPANQRKLEATEALHLLAQDAGMSLMEMALAFVTSHRAVTAAVLGPRTVDQLEEQLNATSAVLTEDILARIDEIVPPGVTVNPTNSGWMPPALRGSLSQRPGLRRAPVAVPAQAIR